MRPLGESLTYRRVEKKEEIGNANPKHVAIIPDGNRRWAREKGLEIAVGYQEGAKRIADVAKEASRIGIENLTFWIVSPDNIVKRDPVELGHWWSAMHEHIIVSAIPDLVENGVRIKNIGQLKVDALPKYVVGDLMKFEEQSKNNLGMTLAFALNYDGNEELDNAFEHARMMGEEIKTASDLREHLYTNRAGMPDPEWVVRTGKVHRLSAFMPLQVMAADYDFPDIMWPDFSVDRFLESIQIYKGIKKTKGA
jgi:undecaprenyl diphosphate synthase